ncbi:hypothetical protein RFI_30332 [Reticulomyxa filosa]|uniref:RING-type domain-containing protein n=1 Tax=Reticulomyxa filosa TaxID=46433 RepID=X6M0X5_RETFI|nr:hypothetical protein RFI_30332 [Reticulomyxa filosa]|eukprot:ETO07062.1 hypothetical protein RFI_30332 [Reticulomyxa filosa]
MGYARNQIQQAIDISQQRYKSANDTFALLDILSELEKEQVIVLFFFCLFEKKVNHNRQASLETEAPLETEDWELVDRVPSAPKAKSEDIEESEVQFTLFVFDMFELQTIKVMKVMLEMGFEKESIQAAIDSCPKNLGAQCTMDTVSEYLLSGGNINSKKEESKEKEIEKGVVVMLVMDETVVEVRLEKLRIGMLRQKIERNLLGSLSVVDVEIKDAKGHVIETNQQLFNAFHSHTDRPCFFVTKKNDSFKKIKLHIWRTLKNKSVTETTNPVLNAVIEKPHADIICLQGSEQDALAALQKVTHTRPSLQVIVIFSTSKPAKLYYQVLLFFFLRGPPPPLQRNLFFFFFKKKKNLAKFREQETIWSGDYSSINSEIVASKQIIVTHAKTLSKKHQFFQCVDLCILHGFNIPSKQSLKTRNDWFLYQAFRSDCQMVVFASSRSFLADICKLVAQRKRTILLYMPSKGLFHNIPLPDITNLSFTKQSLEMWTEKKKEKPEKKEGEKLSKKQRQRARNEKFAQLREGLKSIGLIGTCMDIFIRHHIDDSTLPLLDEKALTNIKELTLGDRIKILKWLQQYQSRSSSSLSSSAPSSLSSSSSSSTTTTITPITTTPITITPITTTPITTTPFQNTHPSTTTNSFPTNDAEDSKEKENESKGLCVCCYDAKANMVFIPCGHLSLCEECAKERPDTCPICNRQGTSNKILFAGI